MEVFIKKVIIIVQMRVKYDIVFGFYKYGVENMSHTMKLFITLSGGEKTSVVNTLLGDSDKHNPSQLLPSPLHIWGAFSRS